VPVTVNVPVADGVNVTWQLPELSVHVLEPNEPPPFVVQVTVPMGTLAGVVLSVTVAVQVTALLITAGFDAHVTLVALASPPLTVTDPADRSRLNMPAQVAPPGMQSLMLELNDADARVSPSMPMI
jgi:hypothetical protein